MSHHAVVWLDHQTAKIFHFHAETVETLAIEGHPHRDVHHRGGKSGRKPDEDRDYYHAIATALTPARKILVVGPSTAKLELLRHVHQHDRPLESRIVGVETVDHPSDGQLIAYATRYFKASDRMG